jgi:hypothetical protein
MQLQVGLCARQEGLKGICRSLGGRLGKRSDERFEKAGDGAESSFGEESNTIAGERTVLNLGIVVVRLLDGDDALGLVCCEADIRKS